jgi:hypothetical protein
MIFQIGAHLAGLVKALPGNFGNDIDLERSVLNLRCELEVTHGCA